MRNIFYSALFLKLFNTLRSENFYFISGNIYAAAYFLFGTLNLVRVELVLGVVGRRGVS